MRIIFSLNTAGVVILAVAASLAADDAIAGRGGGSHGGFRNASRGGPMSWNRSFLPAQGEMNTGGHWVGGSAYGNGVGMHWVPNNGGYGSAYSGYGGYYGGGRYGQGYDGYTGGYFQRYGLGGRYRNRYGDSYGNDGGYWGGGGVWYGDLGDDYGYDYPSRGAGFYPALGYLPPPPAYEPAAASTYRPRPASRAGSGPTFIDVSAPAAPNPHIIYLSDEPYRKRTHRHGPALKP
ncbi:MAG TPA: hypothetical protein VEH76_05070 [Methylocystis sp.]|nr:hypothetical protein [Methylocystis sp.]